VHRESKEVEIW